MLLSAPSRDRGAMFTYISISNDIMMSLLWLFNVGFTTCSQGVTDKGIMGYAKEQHLMKGMNIVLCGTRGGKT